MTALASVGLDVLVQAAAMTRPHQPALFDAGADTAGESWTTNDVARMTEAVSRKLASAGLAQGARAIVVGVPRASAVFTCFGALAAGIELMLAPTFWEAPQVADLAYAVGATALIGPCRFGERDVEAILFETARLVPDIRVVATFGPGTSDGTADLSPSALAIDTRDAATRIEVSAAAQPGIGFCLDANGLPSTTLLSQAALATQAMALVTALRPDASRPILSLLSPASVAGFVAGPVASLLAGVPLLQFGPFTGRDFVALLDAHEPVHLVAPASITDHLARACLLDGLKGLVLVEDGDTSPSVALPPTLRCVRIRTSTDGRLTFRTSVVLEAGRRVHHSQSSGATAARIA